MASRRPRLKVSANLSIKRPTKSSASEIKTNVAEDGNLLPSKEEPKEKEAPVIVKVEKKVEENPKIIIEDVQIIKPAPSTMTPTSASESLEFKFPNPIEQDTKPSDNKFVQNIEPISPKKDLKAHILNSIHRKRIRTESVTSTKSTATSYELGSKSKKRTDDSQRVSDSKRDFRKRLNNIQNIDKQSLTMFDMIYYNPAKNPMKTSSTIPAAAVAAATTNNNVKLSAENIPAAIEKEIERPPPPPPPPKAVQLTPQLKLGPNGEMILDEKSLIIENEKEKELRDSLAKSEIVYDDEFSGNSGYYHRIARTREWPPDETIRFYRCLHTIGTDFSMMQQLFPNRSRRDLKLKFKKEEKLNLGLINKALLFPKQFNIEDLQKQFLAEDEEILKQKEIEKQKKAELDEILANQKKVKTKMLQSLRNKNPKRKISKSQAVLTDGDILIDKEPYYPEAKAKKPAKKRPRATKKPQQNSVLPEIDYENLDINAMEVDIIDGEPDSFYEISQVSEENQNLCDNNNYAQDANIDMENIIISTEEALIKYGENEDEIVLPDQQVMKKEVEKPSAVPAFPLDIDINSLVLVESQDTMIPEKTIYEIYVISPETGVLSEKPLDVPEDVVDMIRSIIEGSED